jgi:hypothetical protein
MDLAAAPALSHQVLVMSLKRWTLSFALFLPILGVVSLTGCGDAPADVAPPADMTPEQTQDYEEQMRKTGGRG